MDEHRSERLPRAFFTPRSLRRANLVAVAATLAACTGVVTSFLPSSLTLLDHGDDAFLRQAVGPGTVCSATTLVFALLWASSLRTRFGTFPRGWFVAVPLAALNAGTALGLLFALSRGAKRGSRTSSRGCCSAGPSAPSSGCRRSS